MASLSEIAGIDLTAHGTTSDEETIKDTAVAQPLIVAAGLVAAKSLFDVELGTLPVDPRRPLRRRNHGLGTGRRPDRNRSHDLRPRTRQRHGAAAAAATPTGMSAVVGGDPAEVLAAIEAAAPPPANVNGAGQIVAAGTLDQLKALADNPPAKARVIPLKVAGAFHTSHMAPAVRVPCRTSGRRCTRRTRQVPLLSNYDGAEVTDGGAAVDSLIAQVSRPVRWDLCMETLVQRGVTGVIELAPAGTLAGLAKRGMPGVKTVTVKTPDDLSAALALFAELEGQA